MGKSLVEQSIEIADKIVALLEQEKVPEEKAMIATLLVASFMASKKIASTIGEEAGVKSVLATPEFGLIAATQFAMSVGCFDSKVFANIRERDNEDEEEEENPVQVQ